MGAITEGVLNEFRPKVGQSAALRALASLKQKKGRRDFGIH
jgi:hypothetical protein